MAFFLNFLLFRFSGKPCLKVSWLCFPSYNVFFFLDNSDVIWHQHGKTYLQGSEMGELWKPPSIFPLFPCFFGWGSLSPSPLIRCGFHFSDFKTCCVASCVTFIFPFPPRNLILMVSSLVGSIGFILFLDGLFWGSLSRILFLGSYAPYARLFPIAFLSSFTIGPFCSTLYIVFKFFWAAGLLVPSRPTFWSLDWAFLL